MKRICTYKKAPKSTKKHIQAQKSTEKHQKRQKAQKRNQAKPQNANKRTKIKNALKKHLSGKKLLIRLSAILCFLYTRRKDKMNSLYNVMY